MARIQKDALEVKIRKAEEKVFRTSEAYEAACQELKDLRAKLAAIEHEELIAAFVKSGRSYHEVMEYLKVVPAETVDGTPVSGMKRRRGRKQQV